jgi:hypothetical protein
VLYILEAARKEFSIYLWCEQAYNLFSVGLDHTVVLGIIASGFPLSRRIRAFEVVSWILQRALCSTMFQSFMVMYWA